MSPRSSLTSAGASTRLFAGAISQIQVAVGRTDCNLRDAAQRLGGTTGARPDEGPDDEGDALAESPG